MELLNINWTPLNMKSLSFLLLDLICFISGTFSITLRGSPQYAVPGKPYTLICSVPGQTVSVKYRRTTMASFLGVIQVAGSDCYNTAVTPNVKCNGTVCSCVNDGAGKGSEFNWTFTPDNNMDQSMWYCLEFNKSESERFTLQFAVPVTDVVLQNPPSSGSDLTVIEGTMSSLVCVTSACRPFASVLWYIGRKNYTSFSTQTVTESENLHITRSTLTFNPNRTMNGGKINCSAYNYGGNIVTANNLSKLNVQYPSDNKATMNVSSVSIKEGKQVNIMCEVKGGNPKAQITWSCFGGTATDASTGTDSRSVVTLEGNSNQDGQICTCRGQHNLTTITKAQVTFNVTFAPKNTSLSPSGQQTVTEKQDLQPITCFATCNPACHYTWSRQGNSTTIQGAVLRLDGITRDKEGVYKCTASNTYGNKSISVTVVVNYKPGNSVTLNPSDNTYIRNETDVLPDITCEAACKPSCSYVWMLPSNNNKTGHVLSLSVLKRDEQGKYTCVARNVIGESVKTVSIVVQYGPGKSVALIPSNVAYVKNESDILPDISCVADCRPNCTYKWMFPSNTNTSGPVLSLSILKRDKQGIYKCFARNIVGESVKTMNITVQYGPGTSIRFNSTSPATQMENTTLAPVECSADCRPSCTTTWTYEDGMTLSNPLSLDELKRDEAGNYTCTAANIVHSRSQLFIVHVQYPPRITSLKHVTSEPNISEHSSITLSCKVESYPQSTISWFNKSGKATPLQTDSSVLVSSLTLQSATCFDTGQYICAASNGLRSNASSAIAIYVLCSPRLYKSSLENDVGIGNGENLNTSVQFLANPPPMFTWEFRRNTSGNFTKLNNNSNNFVYYSYHQHVVHTSTVIRLNMEEQDFGYYRILADNGVGSIALSTINVVSTRQPDPPIGIKAKCIDTSSANISWTSKFNGGKDQYFIIAYKKAKDLTFKEGKIVSDPGKEKTASGIIDQLDDGAQYFFIVSAKNEFGTTNLSMIMNCTTQKKEEQSESLGAVIGGAAGGGLALIIIAVVAVVCYLRKKDERKGDGMELMNQRHGNEDLEDGIKPNIIYESAGPDYKASPVADNNQYAEVGSQRNAKTNDVCAEVDKNRKQETVAAVYAEVVKPKGKKQKAEKRGKKKIGTSNTSGDVYENVDAIGGTSENGDVYENSVKDKDQNNKILSRKKNKDGLVYIDVVIKDTVKGEKKGVIHGIENRNNYAEVDFTRHADPLPSDDEEIDSSEKTTATPDESY